MPRSATVSNRAPAPPVSTTSPPPRPVVRFLDTRGLDEVAYEPGEDIRYCETQAHLVLAVMKATDLAQGAVFAVLHTVRRRHPQWPVVIAQTGLHEGYPPRHRACPALPLCPPALAEHGPPWPGPRLARPARSTGPIAWRHRTTLGAH